MIDTMWVAQAAQSGDVAGVGASDFFGNTAQMLENGFTLIVSLFASLFLTVSTSLYFTKFTTTRKTVAGAAHAVSSDCSCRPSAWWLTRLRLLSQRAPVDSPALSLKYRGL